MRLLNVALTLFLLLPVISAPPAFLRLANPDQLRNLREIKAPTNPANWKEFTRASSSDELRRRIAECLADVSILY